MRQACLVFAFLILCTNSILADDAVEAASAGGIVLEKSPQLIMQDETLIIEKSGGKNYLESQYRIDVDFHIKNISDHDVTKKIVFVFPPVQCQFDAPTSWRGLEPGTNGMPNEVGLKDFTATVDGKPITPTERIIAMSDQTPITDLLIKHNIPLNPCQLRIESDNKPDFKYRTDLQKYHLLTNNNYPAWTENIYFEWPQVFPAGKTIHIHHHYTPVVGAIVPSPNSVTELNRWFTQEHPPLIPLWNRQPGSLSTTNPSIVSKNTMQSDKNMRFCLAPNWVRYHLTTGANWRNGIGVFKLIVKDNTGAPFAINQFFNNDNNVQQLIGINEMTFTTKNFIPNQDLLILFLSIPKTNEDLSACGL